jgi:hypothetical protein
MINLKILQARLSSETDAVFWHEISKMNEINLHYNFITNSVELSTTQEATSCVATP